MAMPVGIDDVARAAGVSTATVSRALRGLPDVRESTRKRVEEAAVRLGYAPTPSAVSLASGRTRTIGLLTPWVSRWFHSNAIEGACQALRLAGFDALLYSFQLEHDATRTPIDLDVLRRRVDGVLVVGMTMTASEVALLESLGVPLVYVGSGPPEQVRVHVDDVATARLATQHLLDLGHTRIGFLAGRPDLRSAQLREQGYRDALAAAGVPFDPSLIRIGHYEDELAKEAVRELLTQPEPPTAVFAANDRSALVTLEVAHEVGLRVPDDLSIIGFDDIPESTRVAVPLTTVRQHIQRMGAVATEMLRTLLDGGTLETSHVQLPTELVVRASTAPPR